ncbi:MAG: DNA ligase D [Chitinophagaceae bacterium]
MKPAIKKMIARGDKSPMPGNVSPMLCTLVKEPPQDDDYFFEIKWDGYRINSFIQNKKIRLDSRGGKDYTSKYPPVVAALKRLKHDLVLDGEIVVFNEEGLPDFNAVQNYNGHNTSINYFVFDVLWIDGYNIKKLSLTERRQILKSVIVDDKILQISKTFDDGTELFKKIMQSGMEGIVAKRPASLYKEDDRSRDWLKIPTRIRQEFVIGGWAQSEKARSFRSLLFGAYNKGNFEWIGRSGSGYKEIEMPGILNKLKKIEVKKSSFVNQVRDTKGASIHWVKPQLVANFEFAAWTPSGRIRKPATFLGFRNDKDPLDVVREIPKSSVPKKAKAIAKTKVLPKKYKYLNADSNWRYVDQEQKDAEWSAFEMENCTIQAHNLDREIWHSFTKGQLLLYYSEISDWILPHIADRPISLLLKLMNAGSQKKFIKDMENRQPECASVFVDKRRVKKAGKRNHIDYLVCNNRETLLYIIDLGCVDINCWASRTRHIEYPDYIWIDLDPTIDEHLKGKQLEALENDSFLKAIKVARETKKMLDKYKLTSFIKTSGQSGLHIYIPCTGFTFTQTRNFAEHLAEQIHHHLPDISTTNVSKTQRKDLVYIDAGQNDYADTLAAPYSVRPYHKPIVSTPLD